MEYIHIKVESQRSSTKAMLHPSLKCLCLIKEEQQVSLKSKIRSLLAGNACASMAKASILGSSSSSRRGSRVRGYNSKWNLTKCVWKKTCKVKIKKGGKIGISLAMKLRA